MLIIDDEPDIRDVLAVWFSKRFSVRLAANRDDAWQILQREPKIHVILMDWYMEGMSPEEFVAKARILRPDVPIILMTAASDAPAFAANCELAAIIRKPFDIEYLDSIVRKVSNEL